MTKTRGSESARFRRGGSVAPPSLVRRAGAQDLDALSPLIAGYPFKPYRNFRAFSRAVETRLLQAEVLATLTHTDGAGIVAGVVAEGAAERALVTWRRLSWDSAFFGLPMARVEHIIGASLDAPAPAAEALDACLDDLRGAGVSHVSARVDAADIAAMHLLEARGFRLMDALVTYIWRPGRDPASSAVRDRGRIRALEPRDHDELLAIATTAYRGFQGRFHLDPHIPRERADALYVEWARQSISSAMADTVLVSERSDGALLGFLAFRRREPVSTLTGTAIFGAGLGACRPDAPGAYAGLIRAGTRWAHEHSGIAECQTQNYNFPTIRIYEAVGARYVRGEYTLHAWLG